MFYHCLAPNQAKNKILKVKSSILKNFLKLNFGAKEIELTPKRPTGNTGYETFPNL